MLYSVKTENKISIYLCPNHMAANPQGCEKIPDVAGYIEKADLHESDHRYKIHVHILKMSENIKKEHFKYNEIKMSNIDVTALSCSCICGQDVSRRMRLRYFPDAVLQWVIR